MDYIGSHQLINWLFVLACLSILQWFITIYYLYKNYSLIGSKINPDAFKEKGKYTVKEYIKVIPFSKDYFYIYWNIYPIIFYAFFYYLDTSWKAYFNQIVMIGGNRVKDIYNSLFINFNILNYNIDYKYIDGLIVFIGIYIATRATFGTQFLKQIQFINSKKQLYWWDARISEKIYWTRFIFLFFNIILVSFIAYLGFKVVLFIVAILSIENLTINPFHPDTYGGLRVLMEISSIILAIYLLRATMGIVGLFDHKGIKDRIQFYGDLYHFSYFFIGIGFIIFFIYKIDKILDSIDISPLLSHNKYKSFSICNDINLSNIHKISCFDYNITYLNNLAGNINNYYNTILHFNKFPIDLSLLSSSIFTFILPLSIWFIINFIKNRTNEIKDKN